MAESQKAESGTNRLKTVWRCKLQKWQNLAWLGEQSNIVEQAQAQIESENIVERLWDHDYTIWNEEPDEISNRLGWLHSPRVMIDAVNEINEFVDKVRSENFDHVLLLGMGGSSLAPEVFRKTFGVKAGYPDLSVLDSTDPDSVMHAQNFADKGKTLFIVSTKSGGTIETMSFMKYFYNRTFTRYGKEKAGQSFVAITDPGSGLEKIAGELGFKKIFLNDPNIGGRFSALSYFGLVPAALVGCDITQILNRAQVAADQAKNQKSLAVSLGIIIGALSLRGKDKLTFLLSPKISGFGGWVEQLIAESTGKEGKGILPVDLESIQEPEYYAKDRLFVHLKLKGNENFDNEVKGLVSNGFPVIETEIADLSELGAQFFIWEIATVIAGYFLKINPFDQPNVESAKILAKAKISDFMESGNLKKPENPQQLAGMQVVSTIKTDTLEKMFSEFFKQSHSGNKEGAGRSYVSIHAYLHAGNNLDDNLHILQSRIHQKTKMATTLGYGPRFLHSTGQLHKGDAGHGLFIQIIGKNENDVSIPGDAFNSESQISFAVLCQAQSLGDREALLGENRWVLRIELSTDYKSDIKKLIAAIDNLVWGN